MRLGDTLEILIVVNLFARNDRQAHLCEERLELEPLVSTST